MSISMAPWYSSLYWSASCVHSEGHAVCQPDGPAGSGHRLHRSTALHTAGGDVGTGQLGRQEVRIYSAKKSKNVRTSVAGPNRRELKGNYF